ncbi:DUF4336 domain-containing protein [Jannaschia pohangensis]|uniref:DUF4336 domain-containing protein n=1 Tax=Jannaschia pohangensis TaxID=390807 RepID=A0A1I3SGN1_9RHOB|nr:DUF4336 domain-containing protein [Jannaschia pohangensis]SFJ56869.1 protein of unknown function [Jannaschia pohangensis]
MLTEFGPDIWLGDGGEVAVLGFRYPTRMAVMRLSGGDLVVWSPVTLTDALRVRVAELGTVAHIIAPNHLHHLALTEWTRAFPNARVHPAPRLRGKRRDIAFAADLGDVAPDAWAGQIDQAVFGGNRITTEVVLFHRASRTVLFTDLIQHFPPGTHPGWRGVVARLDRMEGAVPAVPRKFRLAQTDRDAARAALRRIEGWKAERLVMAHGAPVTRDVAGMLERTFDWL